MISEKNKHRPGGSPEVSFIVPAYNVGPYIAQSLDCLLSQHGASFEIIIVDDCSSDDTAAIAASYAERYPDIVRFIKSESNRGPYGARKTAIEMASGDIVAPFDADDLTDKDYLCRLVGRMRETHADIVYPVMYNLYDDGKIARSVPSPDFEIDRVYEGRDTVIMTLDGWRIGADGGLVRRSLYLDCFRRYHEAAATKYADEVLTRQLLADARRVAFCDTPYYYRMQPSSVTHRVSAAAFDYLESDRWLLEFIDSEFPPLSDTRLRMAIHIFHRSIDSVRKYASLRGRLSADDRRTVAGLLRRQWKYIEWGRIKGHVSPRYYLLARLGVGATLITLPLYDKIKGSE